MRAIDHIYKAVRLLARDAGEEDFVGKVMSFQINGLKGKRTIAGTVQRVLPDGRLEVLSQSGSYYKLLPSELFKRGGGSQDAWTPEQKAKRDQEALARYNALSDDQRQLRRLEFDLKEAKKRASNARGPQMAQSALASAERTEREIEYLKRKIASGG